MAEPALAANDTPAAAPPPDPFADPADGASLAPGDYLIELVTPALCTPEVLAGGLSRLGFTKAAIDVPPRKQYLRGSLRFVARLGGRLTIRNTSLVRWAYARQLSFDAFGSLRAFDPPRSNVEPERLLPERLYEARFLLPVLHARSREARERYRREADPTRAMTIDRLAEMGFETERLVAMRRDVRMPSRKETSLVLWCGLLRWTGPESVVTEDETFYFDDLIAV